MFKLKGFFQSVVGAISGDKDILEAILFGGVWMAGADGSISKAELASVETSAINDEFVKRIYSADVIKDTMSSVVQKLKVGGPAAAEKELIDIAHREENIRHAVYMSIYRVAAADGNVDGEERKLANRIAAALNLTNEDRDAIEDLANPVKGGFIFED